MISAIDSHHSACAIITSDITSDFDAAILIVTRTLCANDHDRDTRERAFLVRYKTAARSSAATFSTLRYQYCVGVAFSRTRALFTHQMITARAATASVVVSCRCSVIFPLTLTSCRLPLSFADANGTVERTRETNAPSADDGKLRGDLRRWSTKEQDLRQ